MGKYSLTIETDNPEIIHTLTFLADIVLNGNECDLFLEQFQEPIGMFTQKFWEYLKADELKTLQEPDEIMQMVKMLEHLTETMREVADELKTEA